MGRNGAAFSWHERLALRVGALVVTLPAHCEHEYCPPPFVEFPVSCPPPQGTVDVPLGQVFGFCIFGRDLHVFGQSRRQEGSCRVEESLAVCSDLDELGVVDLGNRVVHGHVFAHLVEGPDERLSFVAVGTIYDNVADVWCDLERLEGEFQSDGSGDWLLPQRHGERGCIPVGAGLMATWLGLPDHTASATATAM